VGEEDFTKEVKERIQGHFEIKDLGEARFFLGQEKRRRKSGHGIFVGQEQYTKELLMKFDFRVGKPNQPQWNTGKEWPEGDPRKILYMEMVGSLLYLAVHTRPDISHAGGVLSRYMAYPADEHLQAAKRVLRYLWGTYRYGILFPSGSEITKKGVKTFTSVVFCADCSIYADADSAREKQTKKSTCDEHHLISCS
jgi:hypothetical protein